DPGTGRVYRLEPVDIAITTRGEVAPHSGYGIPEMTHATEVRVVRFEKVEVVSKLPPGEEIGAASGRRYAPGKAGGAVRELDYSKIKFTGKGVDVVDAHVRRFEGGGESELAMVDRLRRIARGELAPTDFDRRFYTHELRESVRYRALGLGGNAPLEHLPIEVWNNLHTATLEDYRIAERLPDGRRALFHPDIAETIAEHPTGARGGRERPNVPWGPDMPLR